MFARPMRIDGHRRPSSPLVDQRGCRVERGRSAFSKERRSRRPSSSALRATESARQGVGSLARKERSSPTLAESSLTGDKSHRRSHAVTSCARIARLCSRDGRPRSRVARRRSAERSLLPVSTLASINAQSQRCRWLSKLGRSPALRGSAHARRTFANAQRTCANARLTW